MPSEKAPLLPPLHGKSSDSPPASNSTFDYQTNQTNEQSNGNSPEEAVNVISTYDDVLPYLGDIGVWQGVTVLLLGVLAADGGILVLLQNFTALEPKAFRCLIPSCDSSNSSYSDLHLVLTTNCTKERNPFIDIEEYWKVDDDPVCWRNPNDFETDSKSIKLENEYRKMCLVPIISEQTYFDYTINGYMPTTESYNTGLEYYDQEVLNFAPNCSYLRSSDIAGTETCDVSDPNQKILYEPYEYTSTIVTEFSLVCDQQYKIALSGTFYMIGLLVGSFVGGPPADKFGRKPLLFFFLICAGEIRMQNGQK